MMNLDAFTERAAIMEYEGGVDRFKAETLAAREQGLERWEAIGDVAGRVVGKARDQREAMARRGGEDNVSRVQRDQAEENRSMSFGKRG